MPVQANETMTKLSHPFTFICGQPGCFHRTSYKTTAAAYAGQVAHDESDTCPSGNQKSYMLKEFDEKGQQYTAIHMAKNLGEKIWDYLDIALDELLLIGEQLKGVLDHESSAEFKAKQYEAKGLCRAYAICIHEMQTIYYPTVDDITRQAVKRRKIKLGELEFEPTPGYNFNPPPRGSKVYNAALKGIGTGEPEKPKATTTKTAAVKSTAVTLTPEVDTAIAKALATGLFSDTDIADTFKVPVAYISALRVKS